MRIKTTEEIVAYEIDFRYDKWVSLEDLKEWLFRNQTIISGFGDAINLDELINELSLENKERGV